MFSVSKNQKKISVNRYYVMSRYINAKNKWKYSLYKIIITFQKAQFLHESKLLYCWKIELKFEKERCKKDNYSNDDKSPEISALLINSYKLLYAQCFVSIVIEMHPLINGYTVWIAKSDHLWTERCQEPFKFSYPVWQFVWKYSAKAACTAIVS